VPSRCVPPINPDDPTQSTADYWLAKYPRLALPPVEQEVVGGDWFVSAFAANRPQDDAPSREYIEIRAGNPQVRDYVYARVDRVLGTTLRQTGNPEPTNVPQPARSGFGVIDIPSYGELVAEVEDALAGVTTADPRQALEASSTVPTARTPQSRVESQLVPGTREHSAQRVYELLLAGHTSTAGLAETTKWSAAYVRSLLGDLARDGQARKTDRGQWEVIR
jgi:hypothetical protein